MGDTEQYIDRTKKNDASWKVGDRYEDHSMDAVHRMGVIVSIDWYTSEGPEGRWIALCHEDDGSEHGLTIKHILDYLVKWGSYEEYAWELNAFIDEQNGVNHVDS